MIIDHEIATDSQPYFLDTQTLKSTPQDTHNILWGIS